MVPAHLQNYPTKESNQCEADPKSHREIETFTFIPILQAIEIKFGLQ
jgi:hypothetical protein